MSEREFEKLVRDFARAAEENAVNWEEMKKWWLLEAHNLFDLIEQWLGPLIQSQAVKATRPKVYLTESELGRYPIESLRLTLAGRDLTFAPEGTMLVGAFGRIEANGPRGNAALLLLNTDDSLPPAKRREQVAWFIAHPAAALGQPRRTPPDLRPLTEQSFQQLFADLFGITR